MSCTPRKAFDTPKGRIRSPLHQAIIDRRYLNFRLLIERLNEDVNAKDMYGWTPSTLCCLIDDEQLGLKFLRVLTDHKADFNRKDRLRRTPLLYCCIGGKEKLARHLLKDFERVDFQTPDCYGYTPLMYACMRGKPALVHLLTKRYVECWKSVDEKDDRGRTPLMIACACGNYASAYHLLITGKADKNRRDDLAFRSPLEWIEEGERIRRKEATHEHDQADEQIRPSHRTRYIGIADHRTRLMRLPGMSAMYDQTTPFVCDHASHGIYPYSACFNELARGIPEMFTHFHMPPSRSEELYINDEDSRAVLIAKLMEGPPVKHRPLPPLSDKAGLRTSTSLSSSVDIKCQIPPQFQIQSSQLASGVSTPNLIALRRNQDKMMIPDLTTLFKMYVPPETVENKTQVEEGQNLEPQN